MIVISQAVFSWPNWLRRAAVVVGTGLTGAAVIGWMAASSGKEVFVSIGTGETNGVYYPVVKAICKIVEPDLREQGIRCSAEATPGSAYNVGGVQSGELEFGIVQSDVQFAAYKGIGAWLGKPVPELRSVLSVYPERSRTAA